MRGRFTHQAVLAILLICQISICLGTEPPDPNQSSKYLNAVRTFADNVLKYGRDTYGPKHTPLFVDGLNIHTHEPVKWIDPDGTKWILSNFASQQTLLRTLDGLSEITGDPKYREAAMQAIRYAFDHVRTPSGLFYWGHITAYDALGDTPHGNTSRESIKLHYPYYELMWKVDPEATKKLIEALWCAHVIDWSNLDFDRGAPTTKDLQEPWEHEYKGGPTFFKSKVPWALANTLTGSSLIQAGTTLHRLSRQEQPLVWSKRLAKRFVDTRHPKTGISALLYNNSWLQLGEDMKEHFVDPHTTVFPWDLYEFRYLYYPENAQAHPWMSIFLVGKMLGEEGKEFTQWALEEFTAWGEVSYREKDNSFVPMLTDSTTLEGYVWKNGPGNSSGLNIIKPYPADLSFFWGYSVAYCTTGDKFMWQMVRDIAHGNGLGDIGRTPAHTSELQIETTCSHVYSLLGFLELYGKTKKPAYLEMARRIGDNILSSQFHKGFFVPSKKHIYTRFDCFEPLALLHLEAAIKSTGISVPRVWPSIPLFVPPYRHKQEGEDRRVIYALTESPEPPMSLQEAAAIGDVNLIRTLIENGTDVDSLDDGFLKTALHRAVIKGHKSVAELLLARGAGVNARDWGSRTPLHYATEEGHKEITELLIAKDADVNAKRADGDTPLHFAARTDHKDIIELLIAKGADVNAKNNEGQTPLNIALIRNRKDIVQLLLAKGATISSIHVAGQMGDMARVKAFLEQGADVNAQDDKGVTALHYVVQGGYRELAEFLIVKGANVNGKDKNGYTPLYYAIWYENKDIVKLLVTKGADVNLKPEKDYPPLHYAVWNEDIDTVKLLVVSGAKFDMKDQDGWTAFRYAAAQGNRDIVEFFIAKGADVSSFHMAACMGDLTRVKRFVEQGADVDTKDELGWTPLYWAASTSQTNIAEFLIANGADVNAKTNDDSTPLYQAAATGGLNFVQLLISKGADMNAKDKHGNTPLHSAATAGQREVVELLISKGAIVDAKGRNGRTPLYNAALRGHKDIVEILVAKGADIDAKARSDQTALHVAAVMGRKDMASLLIAKGADLNSKDVNGQTPLHLSVRQGHRDTAELLINKGADVNARNKWDRTPLDIAVDRGHKEIVELLMGKSATISLHTVVSSGDLDMLRRLIAKGADVNAKDKNGRTPLHRAAEAGLDGLVKELIINGADVDATDIYGQTPLHCAAHKGHKNVAECLLAKGAYVDAKDNAGRTPLHYAVGAGKNRAPDAGHIEVVRLFIDKGAKINTKDEWGWTPLHYAVRMANKAMVELLVNKGADSNATNDRCRTAFSLARRCLSLVRDILDSEISDWYRKRLAVLPSSYSEIVDLLPKGGGVYYVATGGKDSNPGTIGRPFRTLGAAIDAAKPGDTIFVRGGLYSCSITIYIDKSGKESKTIRLWAFPGETPIFDFSGGRGRGFLIRGAYWHLKGLTITNAEMSGIQLDTQNAHHNVIEQVRSHGNGDTGINLARGAAHNLILNCDSCQNFDPETDGENADGFGIKFSVGAGNVFIGCRAWNNSDDGYDFWEAGTSVRAEKCYAWRNGENLWDHPCFTGNSNGFKLGRGEGAHVLICCAAWNHSLGGFNSNDNSSGVILYNCTALQNNVNYTFWSTEGVEKNIFRNNLSCKGRISVASEVDDQFNSWNKALGLHITEEDFLSLDDSIISGVRNPDGSLPESNFLWLAPGSDAIDAGTDIGLLFIGKSPDLGAFEYCPAASGKRGSKMLHQAVRDHDFEKIRKMLAEDTNVNEKDWLGYASLHWAVYFGYPDVAEILISEGTNPNVLSDTGRTPLEIAEEMGYEKIVELLKKHGAKE